MLRPWHLRCLPTGCLLVGRPPQGPVPAGLAPCPVEEGGPYPTSCVPAPGCVLDKPPRKQSDTPIWQLDVFDPDVCPEHISIHLSLGVPMLAAGPPD